MKTPINGETLRNHLTYSWWKYVLVAVLAIFGVNLLYTVTAYRPPESKKVLLYIYGYADEDRMDAYMASVQAEYLPDMEEMRSQLLTNDATYGSMQLSTYIAAAEGDIYILPRDFFLSLSAQGAFAPLEEDAELMDLFTQAGASLQSGWRKNTDLGETHLYGIPLARLPGMERYCAVENGYVVVLVTNGNDENVMKFLRILCRDMITAPDAEAAPETETVPDAESAPEGEASETEAPAGAA